ncbi:hypothetical protein U3A55_06400 [Salarchaeum sp. III]|uniref:hypothetical protein n=1 Tax=Salarchaeum sp. III TaxID=3107927 RepID=UPI002ED94EA7
MRRRTVLAAAAGTLATGLAGCTDSTSNAPNVTDTTAGTTTDRTSEGTTSNKTTTATNAASVENTPTAVARAFYGAFLDGKVERANSFTHPESPSAYLPVTEDSVPSQEARVERVEVVDRADDAAAVEVSMTITPDDGTPQPGSETIGLRPYNGEWRIWRNNGCTKGDC